VGYPQISIGWPGVIYSDYKIEGNYNEYWKNILNNQTKFKLGSYIVSG